MTWFDSHTHLGSPELAKEADDILDRARAAGVIGLIAVGAGYGVGPNGIAVSIAERHPDVWATVGVHPHDAWEWNELAERAIDGWLAHPRVHAVGECGLDYWYERSPRDEQRACLRAQIDLAHRHQKPLVIHVRPSRDSRDAFEDILQIFDEANADACGGVIHCFTGDAPFAADCLARNFDISFSGILTFKTAGELRDVARELPLERLMIETDSPLLSPVPYRGQRNEPARVRLVADCLAELRGVSSEHIGAATAERAAERFALGPLPRRSFVACDEGSST